MICRHCQQAKVNRPRGLCWSCYYRPGIREKYPTTSKFGRRGVGNFYGLAPIPVCPTTAPPGSPEKVAVLEERASLKLALWHPDDAREVKNQNIIQSPQRKQGNASEPAAQARE